MGIGAGLSMYVVVVQKFTFAISSPDEFLYFYLSKKFLLICTFTWVLSSIALPNAAFDLL